MTQPHRPDEAAVQTAPPPPPRPLTPAVRRRAWGEPGPRTWVLLSLAIFAVIGFLVIQAVARRSHQAWLREHGQLVQATLWEAGQARVPGRPVRPDMQLQLEFTLPPDRTIKVQGQVASSSPLVLGQQIPLRVNPENPEDWSADQPLPPLGRSLAGPVWLLPVLVLCATVAWWMRRRVVRDWVGAPACPVQVVDAARASLALRGWTVRCVRIDRPDRRVLRVFLPAHAGITPRPGLTLWAIGPDSSHPLAAAAYQTAAASS